jgi:methylglutaconyl-CoA hydratase
MAAYKTIRTEREGSVARVILAREPVRNAFDETMIAELQSAFRELRAGHEEVRAVVIEAEGPVFCAGADLNWMKRCASFTPEENLADSLELAALVQILDELPQPTICRVQGPALGGGVGVVAACDIVAAADTAFFALSEVRLGLAPAVISPYVIRRIGPAAAREYFLTGERFSASRAYELGLVNRLAAPGRLDAVVQELIKSLLQCGPVSQAACKHLIRNAPGLKGDELNNYTARVIADLRAGEEGKEGVRAFLERRRASWKEEV